MRKLLFKKLNINYKHFNKLNSTSTYAKEHFDGFPLLVCAKSQTAGRGRQGKNFFSPKGGLYFSLALPDSFNFTHLTALCGVSVCKAIEALTDLRPEIKWVNDIYINNKKVCGILVEKVTDGVIIGIGINLKRQNFPDEIPEASSIGRKISQTKLIYEIVNNILNISDFHQYYKDHSYVLGKKIFFIENNEKYDAFAENIDDNFGLIVKLPDGSVKTLTSGEISVRLS